MLKCVNIYKINEKVYVSENLTVDELSFLTLMYNPFFKTGSLTMDQLFEFQKNSPEIMDDLEGVMDSISNR